MPFHHHAAGMVRALGLQLREIEVMSAYTLRSATDGYHRLPGPPQDQEAAQHSKYALLRPSVPLGSECLVRVFFLDTLGTAQQLVLAATVPVERVQDRSVEIRHAVEAFLEALGLQPLSIQLEVFTTKSMEFGDPTPRGKVVEFPVRR